MDFMLIDEPTGKVCIRVPEDGPEPGSANEIAATLGCEMCVQSRPEPVPLETWQRLTAGITPTGIQIWCLRHQANVLNLDFRGLEVKGTMLRVYFEIGGKECDPNSSAQA